MHIVCNADSRGGSGVVPTGICLSYNAGKRGMNAREGVEARAF